MSINQNHIQAASYTPPPPGSIKPGTVIHVGRTDVIVERFLAQGGFAHVYVVTINGENSSAVLKRVVGVQTEAVLADLQNEITTMEQLRGHKNIVRIIDSSIGKLLAGGYEVFILMEYCTGGHLVDFMNTRLTERLAEHEILKIFSDICQGVAHMHTQNPPIIHRDLKIENVLISGQEYKVCDFGSATRREIRPGPLSALEIRQLSDEIGKYTTLQYRAPELCDLYQKRGISTKIDMWALGVLFYKLCYFTTPFEEQGTLAILNCKYTFPNYPSYSVGLHNIVKMLLQVDVDTRADIFEVYDEVCRLRGVSNNLQQTGNVYPNSDQLMEQRFLQITPQLGLLSLSDANKNAQGTLESQFNDIKPKNDAFIYQNQQPISYPLSPIQQNISTSVGTSSNELPLRRGRIMRANLHQRHQSANNPIGSPYTSAALSSQMHPAYQAMVGNAEKNRMSAPLHYMFNSDDSLSKLLLISQQDKRNSTGALHLSLKDIEQYGALPQLGVDKQVNSPNFSSQYLSPSNNIDNLTVNSLQTPVYGKEPVSNSTNGARLKPHGHFRNKSWASYSVSQQTQVRTDNSVSEQYHPTQLPLSPQQQNSIHRPNSISIKANNISLIPSDQQYPNQRPKESHIDNNIPNNGHYPGNIQINRGNGSEVYEHKRNNSGLTTDDVSAWEIRSNGHTTSNEYNDHTLPVQNRYQMQGQQQQQMTPQSIDPFEQLAVQRSNKSPSILSVDVNLTANYSSSINSQVSSTPRSIYNNFANNTIMHNRTLSNVSQQTQGSLYVDASSTHSSFFPDPEYRNLQQYSNDNDFSQNAPNTGLLIRETYAAPTIALTEHSNDRHPVQNLIDISSNVSLNVFDSQNVNNDSITNNNAQLLHGISPSVTHFVRQTSLASTSSSSGLSASDVFPSISRSSTSGTIPQFGTPSSSTFSLTNGSEFNGLLIGNNNHDSQESHHNNPALLKQSSNSKMTYGSRNDI